MNTTDRETGIIDGYRILANLHRAAADGCGERSMRRAIHEHQARHLDEIAAALSQMPEHQDADENREAA
jgi:hypothetical protein